MTPSRVLIFAALLATLGALATAPSACLDETIYPMYDAGPPPDDGTTTLEQPTAIDDGLGDETEVPNL